MPGVPYSYERKPRSCIQALHRTRISFEYKGVAYISEDMFFRFVSVHLLRARHRGQARCRRGCQRVFSGRRGGGCKERGRCFRGKAPRVHRDTREARGHAGSMDGLCLACIDEI